MTTWQDRVRQAAQEAALAEDRTRWGLDPQSEAQPPFAYRWEHIQLVVEIAQRLARETGADMDVVLAAAWLHDIRKGSEAHAQQGANAAREVLTDTDFPQEKLDAVAEAIAAHEGLWRADPAWEEPHPFVAALPMTNLEAGVLWDADKLAKIGPAGALHAFGSMMAQGTTSQELAGAIVWWREEYTRTLASFTTAPAKSQARRLYDTTLRFLLMLGQEYPAPSA